MQGITHQVANPGTPAQNAYIESFNGQIRDELLNALWFLSVP
ncbi:integrase core domain-containing protein [Deinococcus aquaedulcis]